MKNLFKTMMLVAVAAMGFTACSNDKTADVAPEMEQKMVTMTITAEDATRTFLKEGDGVVNFGWNGTGEVIYGMEFADAFTGVASTSYDLNDGKAAFTFKNAFPAKVEATEFTYNAIYPEDNRVKSNNTDVTAFKLRMQAAQAPTEESYDPAADLMIAKQIVTNARPENLSMQFQRIVAMGKMTFTNLHTESTIEQVIFETTEADKYLAGLIKADLTKGTVGNAPYDEKKQALTLTYAEAVAKTTPVYFVTLPVELSKNFKVVVVTTDGCTFTREVNLADAGKTLKFTAGNLSAFTVNMNEAEKVEPAKDVYTLLTDVSKLNIGDKIVITNKASAGSAYALSTTQASNNRKANAITIKNVEDVMTLENNAEMAVLEVGENNGYWTLYDPENTGYLYAASSGSNHLKTQKTLDGNGTWSIVIANDGKATIKAQGSNTRNLMRYNANNGSPIFSCYGSGQSDVYIYLNDCGTGEKPVAQPKLTVAPTTLSFEAAGGEKTITATLENSEEEIVVTKSADWLTITGEGTYTVTAEANEGVEARKATITVTAGELSQTVTVSQAAAQQGGDEPGTGGEENVLFSEDFSSITTGENKTDNGSSTKWNGNSNFNSVTNAYQAGGAVRIGKSGATGSLTTKNLDLSGAVTVTLDIKGWTSVEGDINVTIGGVKKTIKYTEKMSGNFGTYSVSFDAGTGTNSSSVTIATTKKRAFIDNIKITAN